MATIKPEDVVTVDVIAAKDLLSSSSRYLDVRTIEEYNKGHVDNALNVPYMFMTQEGRVKNPDFLAQVSTICRKEDHLVVGTHQWQPVATDTIPATIISTVDLNIEWGCNIGGRAMRACVDLLNDGYEQVIRMGGGYSAWAENSKAGKETNQQES